MDLAQVQGMIARCQYQIVHGEIKPHLFEFFYLVQLAVISHQSSVKSKILITDN